MLSLSLLLLWFTTFGTDAVPVAPRIALAVACAEVGAFLLPAGIAEPRVRTSHLRECASSHDQKDCGRG